MENQPHDTRDILGRLAQEYGRKTAELEEALEGSTPEQVFGRLRAQAERTTDRFRAAQFALLDQLTGRPEGRDEGGEDPVKAATALCEAYDELRILFQALADHACKHGEGKTEG